MKKWFLCMLALIVMTGCEAPDPVMETVTDDLSQPAVYAPEYEILIYRPQDVLLIENNAAAAGKLYRQEDGNYEIVTKAIYSDTAESAVRQITGLHAEELTVVETTRFGLPEYRFAWFSDGFCRRADLVRDGDRFYCVIFSSPEAAGNSNSEIMTQVFASFGISASEEGTSNL